MVSNKQSDDIGQKFPKWRVTICHLYWAIPLKSSGPEIGVPMVPQQSSYSNLATRSTLNIFMRKPNCVLVLIEAFHYIEGHAMVLASLPNIVPLNLPSDKLKYPWVPMNFGNH